MWRAAYLRNSRIKATDAAESAVLLLLSKNLIKQNNPIYLAEFSQSPR
jgi:hypothetical protein